MAHTSLRTLAAPLAACAALAFAGCSPLSDFSPVNVTNFYGISVGTGGCAPGSVPIVRGRLAKKYGTDLWISVELTSELTTNASPIGRANTMNVQIDNVHIEYSGEGITIPEQDLKVAVIVPPAGTATTPVPLLDAASGKELKTDSGVFIATITLQGHTADGASFSTTPATFPVAFDKAFTVCPALKDGTPVDPVEWACGMVGTPEAAVCPAAAVTP